MGLPDTTKQRPSCAMVCMIGAHVGRPSAVGAVQLHEGNVSSMKVRWCCQHSHLHTLLV